MPYSSSSQLGGDANNYALMTISQLEFRK